MGSMFGGGSQKSQPMPAPKPATPLPVENEEATRRAAQKRVAEMTSRSGRKAQMLTGRLGDKSEAITRSDAPQYG